MPFVVLHLLCYSRNTLPRLVLEKTEKEMKKEEMQKEREKFEAREKREKWLRSTGGLPGEEKIVETTQEKMERINDETWLAEIEKNSKGKKRNFQQAGEQPQKRRKRERGWRKEDSHSWGLEDCGRTVNESNRIIAWLKGTSEERKATEVPDVEHSKVSEKNEGGSDEPGGGRGLHEVMKSGCVLANTGMAQVLAITWVPILAIAFVPAKL